MTRRHGTADRIVRALRAIYYHHLRILHVHEHMWRNLGSRHTSCAQARTRVAAEAGVGEGTDGLFPVERDRRWQLLLALLNGWRVWHRLHARLCRRPKILPVGRRINRFVTLSRKLANIALALLAHLPRYWHLRRH